MANIEKEIDQTIISNERFDQLWSNNRKKANTPHKRLPPFLLLENHKVASSGNITVVSGAQKSGKSAFQGMIISKFLNPVPLYDTPALEVFPNTDKKAIIHIDTEQSEEDHIDFLRSITKRLDINELPDHFYSFGNREESFLQQQNITEKILEKASSECGGIHAIFIDGGADFLASVNDETNGNLLISWFTKMATKHTCPVFVIVHTNPPAKGVSSGDEKERGHFGSSLMRKCYSILNVSKKGDVSTVQGRNLRRARSGVGFQFMWMDNIHLHMEVGQDHKVDIEADRKAEKIKQWKIDAAHVFGQSTPTYKEAVTGVMKTLDCSEKTAKRRLQDWRENGIIKASDIDKKYRLDI